MANEAASKTTATGTAPAAMPEWADGDAHRVDPRAEGVRSFAMGDARYRIDARGAVVTRGTIARPLPARAFEGIAARAMEAEDGTVTVTLELMHADASLSVPVLVARDLHDVAADWRAWSARTGLPMLMVESNGSVEELDVSTPRVEDDAEAAPRPRFRARHAVGLGIAMRIGGREAVARA